MFISKGHNVLYFQVFRGISEEDMIISFCNIDETVICSFSHLLPFIVLIKKWKEEQGGVVST